MDACCLWMCYFGGSRIFFTKIARSNASRKIFLALWTVLHSRRNYYVALLLILRKRRTNIPLESQERQTKPKVVSWPLIDEMTPMWSSALSMTVHSASFRGRLTPMDRVMRPLWQGSSDPRRVSSVGDRRSVAQDAKILCVPLRKGNNFWETTF